MGVAGAGKTTSGCALADALHWTFYDADDFHSPENVEKMRRGDPLTDADRQPWLDKLRARIAEILGRGQRCVLACSALKEAYRKSLVPATADPRTVKFVFLEVPASVLRERLAARKHYFRPELLDSQLATLERPRDALIVDGTLPVTEIVRTVAEALGV